MLTTYLKREATRATYYGSPAGSYLDEFTGWLARRGFHEEVICQYLPGTIRFAAWGEKTYGNLTSLPADALSHFGVHLAKCGRLLGTRGQHSVDWLSAQRFVEYLRLQHKIADAETSLRTKPALLSLFEHWMQIHRGVKPSTLGNYQPHIVELLSMFGESAEHLGASALHSFILTYAKKRSHALVKKRVTAIRMFLRFLIATERCQPCLEAAIPTIAEWPLARLPRYLRPEDVERVLAGCTCTTPIGVRDNAILLLLARLGLRASEVADLKFSDIDFRHSFASNALLAGPDRRDHVGRHMLALMTYLGHASPRSTYWYLESSPALMDDIVRVCEQFMEENTR